MKTFDYITAWHEAARPAYEALPQNVRDLVERTARVSADLGQLADCSMPWPDVDNDPVASDVSGVQGFRQAFRQIPAEYLALAAQVVYAVGHWYPSGAKLEVPGRNTGATWKFAHYADQDLRERLGLPARGANGREVGVGYAVHEGAIRITYASDDSWLWHEVAPATSAGLDYARRLADPIQRARSSVTAKNKKHERDSAVYAAFEALKAATLDWPEAWIPFQSGRYMIEDGDLKAREAAKPKTIAQTKSDLQKTFDQKAADAQRELDGQFWFLDHGVPINNLIYYTHRNIFTFGWRDKLTAGEADRILAVISEFPYAYELKCADGRVLQGNIE